MGRGISYLNNATRVTYTSYEPYTIECFKLTIDGEEMTFKGYKEGVKEEYDMWIEENEGSNLTFEQYCELNVETCNEDDVDDDGYQQAWDDFYCNTKYAIKGLFPSLTDCDRFEGNEDRIFLENDLVEIGISEYCQGVTISVRPKESRYEQNTEGLAINWINKVWDKVEAKLSEHCDIYRKVGTFSNGEGVYEKKQLN
jgi:hypothetical protein